MPLYEYKCINKDCMGFNKIFQILHVTQPKENKVICIECNRPAQKVISLTNFKCDLTPKYHK